MIIEPGRIGIVPVVYSRTTCFAADGLGFVEKLHVPHLSWHSDSPLLSPVNTKPIFLHTHLFDLSSLKKKKSSTEEAPAHGKLRF